MSYYYYYYQAVRRRVRKTYKHNLDTRVYNRYLQSTRPSVLRLVYQTTLTPLRTVILRDCKPVTVD